MSSNIFDPRSLKVCLSSVDSWWDVVPIDYVADDMEDMMKAAILAAECNLMTATSSNYGGPFGAAVFQPRTIHYNGKKLAFAELRDAKQRDALKFDNIIDWSIFALGSNLVLRDGRSELHAELVAGQFAAERLRRMNLQPSYDFWPHWLVFACTSAPCHMCRSYFTWCSPRAVLAGATVADTMNILGFHEGHATFSSDQSTDTWIQHLQKRGIQVESRILRKEVIERLYNKYTGPIYNSGKDDQSV